MKKAKDLLKINKKEEETHVNYENHNNEVYPFDGSNNNNLNVNQTETRVSSYLDEPDFDNITKNNDQNKPPSQNDVLDQIHNNSNNHVNNFNNEKKDEMNNFFKDDNKKTSSNDEKGYQYPKFY